MNPVPMWGWAAVIAVLAALLGVQTLRIASLHTDIAETAAAHERAVATQQTERAEAERQAREREQTIAAATAKSLRDKQDENDRIADRLGRALSELRQRPERPAAAAGGVPDPAAACAGQSGKSLARGDAEFLERYAADAAKLAASLKQCVAQYEAARAAVIH